MASGGRGARRHGSKAYAKSDLYATLAGLKNDPS
jgi:hypothetical protein